MFACYPRGMSDLIPALPEVTTLSTVREVQVGRVLSLMIEQGMSQADACREVGIEQRTFQRHASTMREVLKDIQDQTRGALLSGATMAMNGYLKGIGRLIAIVDDDQADRDLVIKATKELRSIVRESSATLPGAQPMIPDEIEKPQTTRAAEIVFSGPITMRIVQHDGIPVGTTIEGTSTVIKPEPLGQADSPEPAPLPPLPLAE